MNAIISAQRMQAAGTALRRIVTFIPKSADSLVRANLIPSKGLADSAIDSAVRTPLSPSPRTVPELEEQPMPHSVTDWADVINQASALQTLDMIAFGRIVH